MKSFPSGIASLQDDNPTVKNAKPKWEKAGMKETKTTKKLMPENAQLNIVKLSEVTCSHTPANPAEKLIRLFWSFITFTIKT